MMEENVPATLPNFEVALDSDGPRSLVVDGVDLSSKVAALRVEAQRGDLTRLIVELKPGGFGLVKGSGVVEFLQPIELDRVLAQLDPEDLEKEALDRMGWDDGANVTKHIIDLIREKARHESA